MRDADPHSCGTKYHTSQRTPDCKRHGPVIVLSAQVEKCPGRDSNPYAFRPRGFGSPIPCSARFAGVQLRLAILLLGVQRIVMDFGVLQLWRRAVDVYVSRRSGGLSTPSRPLRRGSGLVMRVASPDLVISLLAHAMAGRDLSTGGDCRPSAN